MSLLLQFPGNNVAELETAGVSPEAFAVIPGVFRAIILFMISRIA